MKVSILSFKQSEYIDYIMKDAVSNSSIYVCRYVEFNIHENYEQMIPFNKDDYDVLLVFIKENRFLERALIQLEQAHTKNVFVVRLYAIDKRINFIPELCHERISMLPWKYLDKVSWSMPYLVHLEAHVVDHCNLNCKACNNFSPFLKEKNFADVECFRKDVSRLSEIYSGIGRFFLLGGEPLLDPKRCCEMISIYRQFFPDTELRLLTNATLILDMEDWFWDVIRQSNTVLSISLYPPVKASIDKIESRLKEKKIHYIVSKDIVKFSKRWTKYPFEDADFNNTRCGSAGCHYLRKGMIYKCPDAYLIRYIGKEGEKLASEDGMDIYQFNGKEIITKISGPIDLCKKCTYKRVENVEWEVVGNKADENDWFVKNRLEYENELLSKTNNELMIENNELYLKLKSQKKELIENSIAKKQLIKDNTELEKALCEEKTKLEIKYQDYRRINESISYKVGLFITYVPRMIVHGIRKMVE